MREKQSYCCTSFFLFCCCFKQLNEISNVHNEQKCIDLIHGTGLLKMTGYLINQYLFFISVIYIYIFLLISMLNDMVRNIITLVALLYIFGNKQKI